MAKKEVVAEKVAEKKVAALKKKVEEVVVPQAPVVVDQRKIVYDVVAGKTYHGFTYEQAITLASNLIGKTPKVMIVVAGAAEEAAEEAAGEDNE